MPRIVLIRLTASAPASAAAAAIGTMSVTFGVSLAMIGSGQACANAPHELAHGFGVDAEVEPVADVRARDVQLDRREARLRAQHLGHGDELVLVFPGDVGDHRRAHRAQVRKMVGDEVLDAVVIQADRVEQSRGRLGGTRGWVSRTRLEGHRLRDHATQPLDTNERVPSRGRNRSSRCDQHRVLERDTPQRQLQVDHARAIRVAIVFITQAKL